MRGLQAAFGVSKLFAHELYMSLVAYYSNRIAKLQLGMSRRHKLYPCTEYTANGYSKTSAYI